MKRKIHFVLSGNEMKFSVLTFLLLWFSLISAKSLDEDFGYVDVRPGAHMFWVAYHTELPGDWGNHPLILWLQGGPGASGVGYGNFVELGPYDIDGNLRKSRWTKKANLMFVDNPVGTGYSYVDKNSLLTTNNDQIATDLVTLLNAVFKDHPDMQKMPFFIYAESYGGKMTVDFALKLYKAIENKEIRCNFQGVALGDSWIHPMDYVNTWGSFLYWMGIVNKDGQKKIEKKAAETQAAVDKEDWSLATELWGRTEQVVLIQTRGVDFYNVLAEDASIYDVAEGKASRTLAPALRQLYERHVLHLPGVRSSDLEDFMNGPQAKKWNIPEGVKWNSHSELVFEALSEDFMKPVVDSVAELLTNTTIHVAIFNGDLDLICDTPGTYMWVENMENYPQKEAFEKTARKAIHINSYPSNAAYVRRNERLSLFTILNAGHMVPIDSPEMALKMVDMITEYGSETVNIGRSNVQRETSVDNHNSLEYKLVSSNETPLKIVPLTYYEMKTKNNELARKNNFERNHFSKDIKNILFQPALTSGSEIRVHDFKKVVEKKGKPKHVGNIHRKSIDETNFLFNTNDDDDFSRSVTSSNENRKHETSNGIHKTSTSLITQKQKNANAFLNMLRKMRIENEKNADLSQVKNRQSVKDLNPVLHNILKKNIKSTILSKANKDEKKRKLKNKNMKTVKSEDNIITLPPELNSKFQQKLFRKENNFIGGFVRMENF